MPYFNAEKIKSDVRQALQSQAYGGGAESIFDAIQNTAIPSTDYWRAVACELHSLEQFHEALDCWNEAERHLEKTSAESQSFFADKIDTLLNAFARTNDLYFKEQALLTCERLISIAPCEEAWNRMLELIQDLRPERKEVLELVEKMLDDGHEIDCYIKLEKIGISWVNEKVDSYTDLAEIYIAADDPAEALRIWSKAVKSDKSRKSLSNAIFWLLRYAIEEKLDESEYLPEEFERIDD